ncbi:hypothetical protein LJ361_13885 [Brucella sp. JSBI001]|nr:hypothetical protein [Brucella sp. JSBI001]UZD68251.1 hypothetical protein LJ361_13885 [Brucella sp. JSBI001]
MRSVLKRDLSAVLWVNGPGAQHWLRSRGETLIGVGLDLPIIRRQIAAEGNAEVEPDRFPFASGGGLPFRHPVQRIAYTSDGVSGLLLTADGRTQKQRASFPASATTARMCADRREQPDDYRKPAFCCARHFLDTKTLSSKLQMRPTVSSSAVSVPEKHSVQGDYAADRYTAHASSLHHW